MNSNLIHNILNIAIAVTAGYTAFLLATGCVSLPTGTLDCAESWVSPAVTSWSVAGMGILKSLINVFRDGITGLAKRQPPVE